MRVADKHDNSDYVNPTSASAAAPIPPEVFPDELAAQQSDEQGGTTSSGGSGGTRPKRHR